MAASATATRISHISVIFLHGSMAWAGSCCTFGVTSRGIRGLGGERCNCNVRKLEGERGIEESTFKTLT